MKALPITNRRTRAESAFTLLELLVVIAVVVTGAALLVPALAKTRTTSPAFQCMDNARQIALGWTMYASDNNGVLAPNSDGALAGKDPLHPSWVSGMLDFTTTADNTNTAMLVNHSLYPYGAYLGSYVGKNPAVFKCPGDRSAWAKDLTKPRVRSISMNCFVGNPTRSFTGSSKYPVNLKLMQVTAPALMFVTLDEHADSISDGWFATAPDELYQLVDYPAAYHANGCGLSFADGHSEIHKWRDARTTPVVQQGQYLLLDVSLPSDQDVLWLAQHAIGAASYP